MCVDHLRHGYTPYGNCTTVLCTTILHSCLNSTSICSDARLMPTRHALVVSRICRHGHGGERCAQCTLADMLYRRAHTHRSTHAKAYISRVDVKAHYFTRASEKLGTPAMSQPPHPPPGFPLGQALPAGAPGQATHVQTPFTMSITSLGCHTVAAPSTTLHSSLF